MVEFFLIGDENLIVMFYCYIARFAIIHKTLFKALSSGSVIFLSFPSALSILGDNFGLGVSHPGTCLYRLCTDVFLYYCVIYSRVRAGRADRA